MSLARRLAALAEAVEIADGRLDVAPRAVVERAGARLGLGVETVVRGPHAAWSGRHRKKAIWRCSVSSSSSSPPA